MSNGSANVIGPGKRLFAEPTYMQDETSFQVDNTSDAYYKSPYYKQHRDDVLPIPTPPPTAPLNLQDVVGQGFLNPVVNAAKISFHAVGDTGAAKEPGDRAPNEPSVADAMAADVRNRRRDRARVLLPPRRRRLQLRRGPVLLRPVLRAVPRLRPADLRDPRKPRRAWSSATTPDLAAVPTLTAFLRNFCADRRRHPRPTPARSSARP